MTQCCICHKDLKSWESFGPMSYPTCQAHYWEFGEQLEEINAIGSSLFIQQREAFQELLGLSSAPKEARRVTELEKEIKSWEDEIEDLQDEIDYLGSRIRRARNDIRQIKESAKLTPATAGKDG